MKTTWLISLLIITCVALDAKKPMDLTKAKDHVKNYYASGQFEKEVATIAKKAWKKFSKVPVQQNSVIVFDIDDTAISDYFATMEYDFGNLLKIKPTAWAQESNFPAIKPIKELYDKLVNRGFKIVFLSNREQALFYPTKKNLIDQGYTTFERVIVRPANGKKQGSAQFKEDIRTQLVNEGYTIAGCIGDQESDLAGKHTGIKIKLPNYVYNVA